MENAIPIFTFMGSNLVQLDNSHTFQVVVNVIDAFMAAIVSVRFLCYFPTKRSYCQNNGNFSHCINAEGIRQQGTKPNRNQVKFQKIN